MSKYRTIRIRFCPQGHDTWEVGRCYSGQCKSCDKEYKLKNRAKIRAINRKSAIKMRYGLTADQVIALQTQQNKRCAICREEKSLVIDHDHATGQVRGLLCMGCNLLLGAAKDSVLLLDSSINYLRKTHVASVV